MDDTEDLLFLNKHSCSSAGRYTAEFLGIDKDDYNVYLKFMLIGFRCRGMKTEPILVMLNKPYTNVVSKRGKQFVNLCKGAHNFNQVIGKRVTVDIEVLFNCIPYITRIYELEE